MYSGIDAFAVNCVLLKLCYIKMSFVPVKEKLQQFRTTGLRDNCLHYRLIFVNFLFDVTITL